MSRRAPRAGGRAAPAFGLWLKKQRLAFGKRNSYEEIERQLREAGGHYITGSTLNRYETEGRVPDVLTVAVLADLYGFDFSSAMLMLARELAGISPTTVVPGSDATAEVSSGPVLVSKVAIDAAALSTLRQQLIDVQARHDKLLKDIATAVDYFGSIVSEQAPKTATVAPRPRRNRRKNDR